MTDTPQLGRARWVALGVLGIASFLDGLDTNIVTVALPSIQRNMEISFSTAQWTLAGYALAFSMFLITGGRLGDIFGAKRVFMTGVGLFTASSALCGLAVNPEMLVAGRFAQGLMAALMLPQVMAVIVRTFDQKEWALAAGLVGGLLSLGSIGGPLLGGLLTDLDLMGLGWRPVFFVNVPIGLLALLVGARALPSFRADERPRLDMPGVLLLAGASLALMFPLVQGREHGWPGWMFVVMAAAVPLLGGFVVQERRRHRADGSALVPPTLFRQRSFSAGLAVSLLAFTGITSFSFVLTYYLQFGLGWSVGETAFAIAAWPLGIVATFQLGWRFGATRGRQFVAAGALVMALSALAVIVAVHAKGADLSWPYVAGAAFLMGVGMGLSTPILATTVLGDLPPADAGAGSGVVNAMTQFGSATGIAVVGAIFFGMVGTGAGAAGASRVSDFGDGVQTTLWYNVAAFVLTAALTPLLPRSKPAAATDGSEDPGRTNDDGASGELVADGLVPDAA
ncbi:MFS transporter [Streptomyces monashensis]|uniref:MFS transporter n=1 Tax=Streptomyces monashensis TaxID=1678012 RepID=UPI0009A12892|nr:MFS transporter [Streptomyces monashensis]